MKARLGNARAFAVKLSLFFRNVIVCNNQCEDSVCGGAAVQAKVLADSDDASAQEWRNYVSE